MQQVDKQTFQTKSKVNIEIVLFITLLLPCKNKYNVYNRQIQTYKSGIPLILIDSTTLKSVLAPELQCLLKVKEELSIDFSGCEK